METASDIARAVRAGRVQATAVVSRALGRLWRLQGTQPVFTQVFAQEAMAAAQALDDALAHGRRLGPLAGVPVAVKDMFDVAGYSSTGCSRAYQRTPRGRDAALVARLRRAGAVIIGKTNQDELGCGSTGLSSACGPVAHPGDPARIAGGSSSGSAIAVAARVVPLALGSDTGGSVRVPASFCGVLGLKAPAGVLPVRGMLPMAPSLDCPGVLAGTAADLWLSWRVLARTDGCARGRQPDLPYTVAVADRGFFGEVTPDVRTALARVAAQLESLGVRLAPVASAPEDGGEAWADIAWPEFASAHRDLLADGHRRGREEALQRRTAAMLRYGSAVTERQAAVARRRAAAVRAWFGARLSSADAILAPVTPYPAPRASDTSVLIREGLELDVHDGGPARLCKAVNLAGLPAVAVPAGRTGSGLPLGVQLIGTHPGVLVHLTALLSAGAWPN
jgi:Asp-tRNA(Asn)/Glu-tRNA(Gln) amidotransferase A subunit family amidase